MSDLTTKFINLLEIVGRLRAPGGCPWDQRQTPQTFKRYLIEEAHELLEAINENAPASIREELGDLLFQVIFLNNLYQEQNLFTLEDVIDSISQKMIRRHPHVFGNEKIGSEQDLKKKWQEIKNRENLNKGQPTDLFSSIPKSLPALRRAQRVAERAANSGFDWPDTASAIGKLEEEITELKTALAGNKQEEIGEEFGDLLFAVVVIGRKAGIDGEDALHHSTQKFITRYARLQEILAANDRRIAECDTDELLRLWRHAKDVTRQQPDNH
ncbi:nucleoside triphosphate pyrophosphohydrolase [Thiovibrio sp. JS02]